MLWAIYAISKPNMDAVRAKVRPVHNEYLHGKKDMVVIIAPMVKDDDSQIQGTLRIVKASSRADVKAFMDADPLTQAGAFESITITRVRKGHWHPEVAEGE